MRETIRDKERLEHILNAIDDIIKDKDLFTFNQVKASPIIYYGFVKEVEIIGEAVYMLTKEFKESHPQCEWEVIQRMNRIHLIEEYILPCYEVLHSESRKNVTADILKTMQLWEDRLNLQQL